MKGLRISSLLLAASVALAGCGAVYLPSSTSSSAPAASASSPGAVGSPPVSSSSATSSSGAPIPAPSRVTLQDSGKTITLHVGDTFLLALGDQQQWNVQVADQTVLARVPNIMVVRGAQGVYKALKVGTTTLTATGTAPCNTGQVCPMYAIGFHVTVQVQA